MITTESASLEVRQAIESLYETFRRYALKPFVDGCSCCFTINDERVLHSKALRNLSGTDLEHFSYSALLTWGDVDDFKHFLPRFCEIQISFEERAHLDSAIVFSKFRHANWRDWPANEVKAVEKFTHAFWHHLLSKYPPDPWDDIEDWLCAIAQFEDDLRPYLAYWRNTMDRSGCLHLAQMVSYDAPGQTPSNPFWGERREQQKQVIGWLRDPETARAFESAILQYDLLDSTERFDKIEAKALAEIACACFDSWKAPTVQLT